MHTDELIKSYICLHSKFDLKWKQTRDTDTSGIIVGVTVAKTTKSLSVFLRVVVTDNTGQNTS